MQIGEGSIPFRIQPLRACSLTRCIGCLDARGACSLAWLFLANKFVVASQLPDHPNIHNACLYDGCMQTLISCLQVPRPMSDCPGRGRPRGCPGLQQPQRRPSSSPRESQVPSRGAPPAGLHAPGMRGQLRWQLGTWCSSEQLACHVLQFPWELRSPQRVF